MGNKGPITIGQPTYKPVPYCASAQEDAAASRRGFQTIQTNWTLFFSLLTFWEKVAVLVLVPRADG